MLWFIIMGSLNFSFASGLKNPYEKKVPDYQDNAEENVSVSWDTPLADWQDAIASKTPWIIKPAEEITDHWTALNHTIHLIQVAINWLLWILATVALIYVLYCGFLIFTAGSDEAWVKKWTKWIKTAAIALAWIWLSWLIVSAILWLINNLTPSV